MRILHVTPYMHSSAGGPPVVVENFVREVKKLGHRSEIISTSRFCSGDRETLLKRLNKLAPACLVSPSKVLLGLLTPAWQALRDSIHGADLVHLHTLWNPINVAVRKECESCKRPYLLMPHGMLDPYSLSVKRWKKAVYLAAFERRNIQAAQRIIYTTDEEVRLAASGSWPLPKGVVIPLGGDAPAAKPDQLASRFFEKFPKARARRRLLFLGRLHFKKGLDRILSILPSVVRACPGVLLTIAGDGTPDFERALRSAVANLRMEDNVMMTGRLEGNAKWEAYAAAELFLLPSRQENFAITVAEAMHMGVPVIISDKVNTWPYVRDADAGVVLGEHEIEQSMQHNILSLLQQPTALRQMGQRGQDYARKNLTWAGAGAKLLSCYDEVVADWQSRHRER